MNFKIYVRRLQQPSLTVIGVGGELWDGNDVNAWSGEKQISQIAQIPNCFWRISSAFGA